MFEFLARAAAAAASSSSRQDAPKPDADTMLARLALTARLYAEPFPFKPGELVTPRADGKAIDAGEPYVVVEVLKGVIHAPIPGLDGARSWSAPIVLREPTADAGSTGSAQFGQVLDMRVARYVDRGVCAYVVESQDFEAWTPAHEQAWRAKLAAAAAGPQPLTLTEAVSALRDHAAGKAVKAEWKEGDTVEIVPEPRGAEKPMDVEGLHVGVVQQVDPSDGTTQVLYHGAETGRIGRAWIRNVDLRKWGPKPAPVATPAPETATA